MLMRNQRGKNDNRINLLDKIELPENAHCIKARKMVIDEACQSLASVTLDFKQ